MGLQLVSAPVMEPLRVDETKAYLRVDGTEDDELIALLIQAARRCIDGKDGSFGRALVTQTWDLFLDSFPYSYCYPSLAADYQITIPLAPLQAVTSITYTDLNGQIQSFESTDYIVDPVTEPGRILPVFGKFWPRAQPIPNAVAVRFVAGYGTREAVPDDIKTWLKQIVAYFYEARSAALPLPTAFFGQMDRYRVAWQV